MTLKELAVDHPYYCANENYFSNEASGTFDTMEEFLDAYEKADISMNLIFRWDIYPIIDENGEKTTDSNGYGVTDGYWGEVFIMGQRKGAFRPNTIKDICEKDVPRLVKLLEAHWEEMKEMWVPIYKSNPPTP